MSFLDKTQDALGHVQLVNSVFQTQYLLCSVLYEVIELFNF